MKLKGLAVAAALMILGVFLFMNYMERQQVRELSRRKPVPTAPANAPQGPRTEPSAEIISDLGRMRDSVVKECVARMTAPGGAAAPDAATGWGEIPLQVLARSLACEALAEKKVTKCAILKDLGKQLKFDPGGSPEDSCSHLFYNLSGVYAAVQGSPQAIDYCIEAFKTNSPFKENKLDAACRLWVDSHKNAKVGTVCKDMAAYVRDGVKPEEFIRQCGAFAEGVVDPKTCYGIPDPFTRTLCLERSAVFTAARAKDPGKCGTVESCRSVMMGSGEACAPLKQKAYESYCTGRAIEDIRTMYSVEMQFRFENSLPAYRPGDNFLTRMSPEDKKRAVEDLQRTSKR